MVFCVIEGTYSKFGGTTFTYLETGPVFLYQAQLIG